MKINNIISVVLVSAIFLLVIISTVVKVSMNHNEREMLVVTKRIEEAARKCSIEEKCSEEIISLGLLIQKGDLDKQVHPKTKEYISEGTPILCKSLTCEVEIP